MRGPLFRGGVLLATAVGVVVVLSPYGPPAHAQNPALEDLLDWATLQVVEFVEKFSSVVAEENYVQEMTRPRRKRTLRSDLALVRYPGATQWLLFRDVYEVDGKPVRDEAQQQRMLHPTYRTRFRFTLSKLEKDWDLACEPYASRSSSAPPS